MSERAQGTGLEDGALATQADETPGDAAPVDPAPGGEPATGATSMLHLSPKWQMVLIGGAFIALNIMVMVIFAVVLFLRH